MALSGAFGACGPLSASELNVSFCSPEQSRLSASDKRLFFGPGGGPGSSELNG